MSKETIEWLNANTMLGQVRNKEKYAKNNWMILQNDGSYKAWWQTEGYDMAYDGFIPVDDIMNRLFNWEPIEVTPMFKKPCTMEDMDGIDGDGLPFRWVADVSRKAIAHPERDVVYSYVGVDSYKVHGYKEWLIDAPAKIVDSGDLGITSVILLRNGGVACVTMSLPDEVEVAGITFNPTIMAVTSIDTTKATTFAVTNLIGVCDNSMEAGLDRATGKFKFKHTARSLNKIGDVRDALGLVYKNAEDFQQWVEALVDVDVTDREFKAIIDGLIEMPEPQIGTNNKGDKVVKNQRSITIAANKRVTIMDMWHHDPRCKPWHGNMFGAFQTYNTWIEHEKPQNDNAVERVMTGTVSGSFAKESAEFWSIVQGMGEQGKIEVPEFIMVGGA